MAALLHAATSTTSAVAHRRFRSEKINLIKPILLISSYSVKSPRRKNHLRQKILKTLKKPIIPKLPSLNPILPIDSPLQEIEESVTKEFGSSEDPEAGNEEVKKLEELRGIEGSIPARVCVDERVGIWSKYPILKYGLSFVGAFVFQTVCAVWFFGSAEVDDRSRILSAVGGKSREKTVLNGDESGNMGLKNGGFGSFGYVDELEMERKIEEIRAMAREVRENERLDSKKSAVDSEDSSEETNGRKYLKSGIEEEVDNRLIKLKKTLGNTRLKMPVASVGSLRKESEKQGGVEKGELDDGESDNDALLFKKKYKFRGLSGDPMEIPKGFGSGDTNDAVGTRKVVNERGTSKQGNGKVVVKPKVVNGIDSQKNNGRSALEPVTSRKLNSEAVNSGKSSANSRGKGVEDANSAMESESETDFWWLNLPYVLAILMRRGDDGEGGEGLYTLKNISSTENRIPHMVAFEDQTDASNFCYLLQSFFEDLGDFSADVIPLTIKELNDAVKLYNERVLVVKRGQLQLYAGQPLSDAEMALRAMIIEQG